MMGEFRADQRYRPASVFSIRTHSPWPAEQESQAPGNHVLSKLGGLGATTRCSTDGDTLRAGRKGQEGEADEPSHQISIYPQAGEAVRCCGRESLGPPFLEMSMPTRRMGDCFSGMWSSNVGQELGPT